MNAKLSTAALTLSILAAFGTGCAQVESDDVATDGIYADLVVDADGSGNTVAAAALRVGGATSNTFVELSDGDSLVAQSGAETRDMVETEILGITWYAATFAIDSANTPFKISFLREEEESAPDSDVTLPAPFSITAPAASAGFSRTSDPITVGWDGSGSTDSFSWEVSGDCIETKFESATDSGTLTIPAGSIQPRENQGANSCSATIKLYRSRSGTLDSAFGEGGYIVGRQIRSISILSQP